MWALGGKVDSQKQYIQKALKLLLSKKFDSFITLQKYDCFRAISELSAALIDILVL